MKFHSNEDLSNTNKYFDISNYLIIMIEDFDGNIIASCDESENIENIQNDKILIFLSKNNLYPLTAYVD